MAANYFLMNGKNGTGNALNMLVDGKVVRGFSDISMLDLQTMNNTSKDTRLMLADLNPDVSITGTFYDLSYPHTRTTTIKSYDYVNQKEISKKVKAPSVKTYAPLFNYDSTKARYYLERLRYYAEERKYNILHDKSVQLCADNRFINYMIELMSDVMNNTGDDLLSYGSLLPCKLKELIKERNEDYFYKSNYEYIMSRYYLFSNILTNYTALRNVTIEYILHVQRKTTDVREFVEGCEKWKNLGLENPKEDGTFNQMNLSTFIDVPRSLKKN